MREILTIALMTTLITSCAGRSPDPVPVVQLQDGVMSCPAIQAESVTNSAKISDLGGEQGGKAAQNVAAGVAGFFFPPLWFAMDFQGAAKKEVAALEQRNAYLGNLALERCAAVASKG